MDTPTIETKISDWLAKQGYPLEMSTAAALRGAGFNAFLSYFYAQDEEVYRQIDVLAWKAVDLVDVEFRISFLIECKVSAKHPWVLFVDPPAKPFDSRTRALMTMGSSLMPYFVRQIVRRRPEVGRTPLFGPVGRPGYGIQAAFANNDIAYQAVMSAIHASNVQLHRSTEEADAADYPVVEFVYPVVVFDNALFEYSLESDNVQRLDNAQSGLVAWPIPGRSRFALVHVVPAGQLDLWILAAKESFELVASDCEPELRKVAERWNENRSGK